MLIVSTAFAQTALHQPPGNHKAQEVPQLVAITFDDNFGLAHPKASGGMDYIVNFYKNKRNPNGTGNPANFDGAPIRTTFYYTSIYVVDHEKKVLGGKPGEDHSGRIRAAWSAACKAGHETAVHTVNHFNGGPIPLTDEDWGRPRNWDWQGWVEEIKSCKEALSGDEGIGAKPEDIAGFRAPYLGYNDSMFTALTNLHFRYDTSIPNCFGDEEDGKNCSWPYRLDQGSVDSEIVSKKFSTPAAKIPVVSAHPGLWELPPTTLIIPPDDQAVRYNFTPGMRERIAKRGKLPYPSFYEFATGKLAGLDYTLLMDAGLSGAEMSVVLKYNLDLHLSGNRSPIIFIAHSHLYTYSTSEDNPDTPSAQERDARWKGLTDFINYALSKPEVRIVAASDVLQWVQRNSAAKQALSKIP